jgi:hypothetical protein
MKVLASTAVAASLMMAGSANAAVNLVVNGDFESGNTGFTSDHTYVAPAPNVLFPEGLYTIGTDPNAVHGYWISIDDPTNMMIVNGATKGKTPVVWEQSIDVGPGSYEFGAQAANVCCNSLYHGSNAPSNLLFSYSFDGINFVDLGHILTAPPGDAGSFYNLGATIVSAANQTLTLRITNDITAAGGNDFAIDNIFLTAVPEPATWAMMITGFGLVGFAMRRKKAQFA